MSDRRELFWTVFAAVLTALMLAILFGFGLFLMFVGGDPSARPVGSWLTLVAVIVLVATLLRAR